MNIDLGLWVLVTFAGIGVFLLSVLGFQILYPRFQAYKRAKSKWENVTYKGYDYGVIIQHRVDEQYDQFIYRINIFSRQNGFVGTVDVPRSDLLKESKVR